MAGTAHREAVADFKTQVGEALPWLHVMDVLVSVGRAASLARVEVAFEDRTAPDLVPVAGDLSLPLRLSSDKPVVFRATTELWRRQPHRIFRTPANSLQPTIPLLGVGDLRQKSRASVSTRLRQPSQRRHLRHGDRPGGLQRFACPQRSTEVCPPLRRSMGASNRAIDRRFAFRQAIVVVCLPDLKSGAAVPARQGNAATHRGILASPGTCSATTMLESGRPHHEGLRTYLAGLFDDPSHDRNSIRPRKVVTVMPTVKLGELPHEGRQPHGRRRPPVA